ncbi:MAG: response regulator [Myxococcota bacterium]
MHCLVIDDEEAPRLLMSALIKRLGHRATTVHSGEAAIAILGERHFDVAIVDMEMPGSDGAETIVELRARQADLKILVVSGHDDRRYVLAALEAGAEAYLIKDEVSELLAATLRDIEAGFTLLSPRIHTSTLRKLLRTLGRPVVEARAEPRSRPNLIPIKPD